MIKRLRIKFVCINMALVMAMLLAILVMVYQFTAADLRSDSVDLLQSVVRSPMMPGRPGSGAQPCFVLHEGPGGELLVQGGEFFDLSDEEMVAQIYRLAESKDSDIGVLAEYSLRYYRERMPFGDRYAFMDITSEQSTLQSLLSICVLIGGAGFAALLGISILLARWAIRPVEQAFEQQRQFVADASHELKTPLTVILTNAELLQSAEYAPEEKEKFAGSILDVSRQMRTLVESLLQLARADRGQHSTVMTPMDLSALVENAVLPFEPVYFEQGLLLESHIEPGLTVRGDATALRQVVDILLDNGQKYTSPGAASVMTLRREGKKAQLRFFTPGTSLTARQCEDIFKRFYRLDQARTMSGSYGLGLSIARNIVTGHGGRIWAEGVTGGNVFTVLLPEG